MRSNLDSETVDRPEMDCLPRKGGIAPNGSSPDPIPAGTPGVDCRRRMSGNFPGSGELLPELREESGEGMSVVTALMLGDERPCLNLGVLVGVFGCGET